VKKEDDMASFNGFPDGKTSLTPIPETFFSELLPEIDHLGELKLSLYVFWRLNRMEGNFRCLLHSDLESDQRLMEGLGGSRAEAEANLGDAVRRAVARGTLLEIPLVLKEEQEPVYFLNSPKGRAAVEAIRQGKWRPSTDSQVPIELSPMRPNIFRLYEDHIGPLTPLISEALNEAQELYPEDWIEDAFRIAVEYNKRSWRYIEAILRRWQEGGRDEQNRGDSQKDRRRYIEGDYADFVEH
jgi:DNA replication protein